MSNERQKEDIIAQTKLAALCRELGLDPDAKGRVARCPAHDDQGRPNLTIYPKNVHCFACGFTGDAFALVGKVKGLDFKGSFDFLAARLGLPLLADGKSDKTKLKGRRLGNGNGGEPRNLYPKPAPLPDSPSPTLAAKGDGLGNDTQGEAATIYPKLDPWPDDFPPDIIERYRAGYVGLPVDNAEYYALWDEFDRLMKANIVTEAELDWQFWIAERVGYEGEVGLDAPVEKIVASGRHLSSRVRAFAALLELGTPASKTQAGEWLYREKGIEFDTQDRFELAWLDDPKAVEQELRRQFGEETLLRLGILGEYEDKKTGAKQTYFAFYRHRLLFPFFWRGEPVDIQGRDIYAKDKQGRFRNTGGKNPIPYNADDLIMTKATSLPLYICEGATDTLAMAQAHNLVIGIVGTGGFKREWLPHFEGPEVRLCFDNDDAGRKAATDVTRLFVNAGLPAPKVVGLPQGIKDVNEFFRSKATK